MAVAPRRLDMSAVQRLGDERSIEYDGTLLHLPKSKSLADIAAISDPIDKLLSAHQWRSEVYARHMKPFAHVVRQVTAVGTETPLVTEVMNGRPEYLAIKYADDKPLARIIDCAVVREKSELELDLIIAVPEARNKPEQLIGPLWSQRVRYTPKLRLVKIGPSTPTLNPINEDRSITRYTTTWLPRDSNLLAVHSLSERPQQERIVFRKLYGKRSGPPIGAGLYAKLLTPNMPIFGNEKFQTLRLGYDQYHHFLRFLLEKEIAKVDDEKLTLSTGFKAVTKAFAGFTSNPTLYALNHMLLLLPLWLDGQTPTEKATMIREFINCTRVNARDCQEEMFEKSRSEVGKLFKSSILNRLFGMVDNDTVSYELRLTLLYLIIATTINVGGNSPKALAKSTEEAIAEIDSVFSSTVPENADIETVIENLLSKLPDDNLERGMDKRLKALILDTIVDAHRAEKEDSELYASEESGSSDSSASYSSSESGSSGSQDKEEASAMLSDDPEMLSEEAGSVDADVSLDKSEQVKRNVSTQMSESLVSESELNDTKTIDSSVIDQYRASSKQKISISSFKEYVHFTILLQFLQGSRLSKRDYEEVVAKKAANILPSLVDSLRQCAQDLGLDNNPAIVNLLENNQKMLLDRYIAKLVETGYVADEEASMVAILDIPGSSQEDGAAEESELNSEGDDESSIDMGLFDSPSTSFVPLPPDTEIHAMFAYLKVAGLLGPTIDHTKMLKIETAVNYRFFRLFDESMNHLYNGRYSSLRPLLNRSVQKLLHDDVYKKLGAEWNGNFTDRLALKVGDDYYWVVGMFFEQQKASKLYQISIAYSKTPLLKKMPNVSGIVNNTEHDYPTGELDIVISPVIISGKNREDIDAVIKNTLNSLYLINPTRLSRFVDVGDGSSTWIAPDAIISLGINPMLLPQVTMLLYNDKELRKFINPSTVSILDENTSQKKLRGSVRRIYIDGLDGLGSIVLDSVLIEPIPIPFEAALQLVERKDETAFKERFGQTEMKRTPDANPPPPPESIETVLTRLKYTSIPSSDPNEQSIRRFDPPADFVGDKSSGEMMSNAVLAALRIFNGGRVTREQLDALKAKGELYTAVKNLLAPRIERIYKDTFSFGDDPDDERIEKVFLFNKENPYDWEMIEAGSGDFELGSLRTDSKRYYFAINRNNIFFDDKTSALARFKKNRSFDYHLDRLVKRDTMKISFNAGNTTLTETLLQCFALAAAQDASHNAHYIKHGGHYIVYFDSPGTDAWEPIFNALAQVLKTDSGRFPVVTIVHTDSSTAESFILSMIGNRPLLAGVMGPFYYFTPVGNAVPALKIRKAFQLFSKLGSRFAWVDLVDTGKALYGQFEQTPIDLIDLKPQHAILAHALLIAHAFTLPEARINAMALGKGNSKIVNPVFAASVVAAFYYPSIALHWDLNYRFGSFLTPSESAARIVPRPSDLRKNKKFRTANDFGLIQNMYTRESRTYQLAKLSAHNQITINDTYKHKKPQEPVDPGIYSGSSIQGHHPAMSASSTALHDSFESSPSEFRSRTVTRTDPRLAQLRSEAHQELIRSEAAPKKKKKPARSKSRSKSRSRSRSRSKSKTPRKSSGKSKSRSRSSSPSAKKTKGTSSSRSRSTSRGRSSKKKSTSRSPSPASKSTKKKSSSSSSSSRSRSTSPSKKPKAKASTKKSTSRSRSTSPSASTKKKKGSEKRGRSRSRSSSTGSKKSSTKGKSASRSPSRASTSSKKGKSTDAGATKRRSRSSSRSSKSGTTDKKSKRSSRSTSPAKTSAKTDGKRSRSTSPSSKKTKETEKRSSRSRSPSGSKKNKEPITTTTAAVTKAKSTKSDGGRGSRSPSPKPKETPKPPLDSTNTKKERRSSRSRSPSDRKKQSDRSSRSPSRKNRDDSDRRDETPQRRRGSSRSPRRAIPVPSVTTTTVVVRSPSIPSAPTPVTTAPAATTSVVDLVAQQQAQRQMNAERRRDEQELANQQRLADLEARRKEQELRKQDLEIQEREAVLRNRLTPSTPAPVSMQVNAPDAIKMTPTSQPQQQQQAPQPASSQSRGWFDMSNLLAEINKFTH